MRQWQAHVWFDSACPTNCANSAPQTQAAQGKEKRLRVFGGLRRDGTHQPADVVARRAAQRVQRVAQRTLEPTTLHPVIGFGVTDQRLDGLAALEPFALLLGQ